MLKQSKKIDEFLTLSIGYQRLQYRMKQQKSQIKDWENKIKKLKAKVR